MANNNSNKTKSNIQPIQVVMIIILLGVVISLGYLSMSDKKVDNETDITNAQGNNNVLFKPDSYSEVQMAKDKDALDSMINFIKHYKPANQSNVVGIVAEANRFKSLIGDANTLALNYSFDTSFTNRTNTLLNLMKQKQIYYYPIFRDSYCKIANRLMGVDDIRSSTSGERNTTLELIGDRYLDSNNVKVDYDILRSHLELLRYKQIVFRTKSENTKVKSYNLNSDNDDAH